MKLYILGPDGRTLVCVEDPLEWALWWAANRNAGIVASITVGHVRISTVLLRFDHSHAEGTPQLFETALLDQAGNAEQFRTVCARYATWEEAEAGHAEIVRTIKREQVN